jgi:hypothetical protein
METITFQKRRRCPEPSQSSKWGRVRGCRAGNRSALGLDRYDLPSVVLEDRYQTRSTILTSQLPVARWHEQIGDPTAADGILDRLVHNAHRIDMRGESMRKKWSTKPTD